MYDIIPAVADGLQIVSSLLFEKHTTFQSLDLLNGFTCHTLGIIKKRKKKSLAHKSIALILFSELMFYYYKFLKITKKKHFSFTPLENKKSAFPAFIFAPGLFQSFWLTITLYNQLIQSWQNLS